MKHTGSCLCGEVSFEVEGVFEGFFLCHCGRCRKGTGSAHGANLFSTTGVLTWLSGPEQVRHFNLKSTRHSRSFCQICGAALPYTMGAEPAMVVVPAGSLDSDLPFQPQAHIFTSERAKWDQDLHMLPCFEQFPV